MMRMSEKRPAAMAAPVATSPANLTRAFRRMRRRAAAALRRFARTGPQPHPGHYFEGLENRVMLDATVANPLPDIFLQPNPNETVIILGNHHADPEIDGTVVQFDVVVGTEARRFFVETFDDDTPLTVANFLKYITSGRYTQTLIHRSAWFADDPDTEDVDETAPFVVQGGGFVINESGIVPITTDAAVQNEPGISNTRGTIAMAKLGGNPNSATSQWFFNMGDNSDVLDDQNGGFTVFGQVLGAGMDVIDDISDLNRYDLRGQPYNLSAFGETPLVSADEDFNPVTDGLSVNNLVRFPSIKVVNEMTYAIVSNTNPDLVTATIEDGQLRLNYAYGAQGQAVITIKSTDIWGNSVEESMTIAVQGAPDPVVRGGGIVIEDGDTEPSPADNTDFGPVLIGAAAPVHTFTITNEGTATLSALTYELPDGFEFLGDQPESLAPGESAILTVRMTTDTQGARVGSLVITSDAVDSTYVFSLSGSVVGDHAIAPVVDLSDLSEPEGGGLIFDGDAAGDLAGASITFIGDINGDGLDDILIGADGASPDAVAGAGAAFVVFGSGSGFPAEFDLADLAAGDGSLGFRIDGIDSGDEAGTAVAAAGDMNGDGFDDFIIAAPRAGTAENPHAGETYVIFGRETFEGVLDLADVAGAHGSLGFRIDGIEAEDQSGSAVAAAGDLNGDGFDDILIAAPQADPDNLGLAGQAYVIFGKANFTNGVLALENLSGTNGFVISGVNIGDEFGYSVAGGGDFNGDGLDDLAIAAWRATADGQSQAGLIYVIHGRSTGFTAELSLDGNFGGLVIQGAATNDRIGSSLALGGDINGDGRDDLIIGSQAGDAYVVFGHAADAGANVATLDVGDLDGTDGFRIHGEGSAISAVASAGDFNYDGFADILLGAWSAGDAGKAYLIYGTDAAFPAMFDLADLDGVTGFTLEGIISGDNAGTAVAGGSDFNGDNFDDLLIGAPEADPQMHMSAGQAFVYFGYPTSLALPQVEGFNQTLLTYTDSEGVEVTVLLRGPGEGLLIRDEAGHVRLSLTGTTAGTILYILTAPHQTTTVDQIDIEGSLNAIVGRTTHLAGSLSATGSIKAMVLHSATGRPSMSFGSDALVPHTTLVIGAIQDLVLDSETPIAGVTATSWTDTDPETSPDTIRAPWLWNLRVTGSLEASLAISGVGAPNGLAVNSVAAGSIDAGTYRAYAGSISSILAAGDVELEAVTLDSGSLSVLRSTGSISIDALGARSIHGIAAAGNLLVHINADMPVIESITGIAAGGQFQGTIDGDVLGNVAITGNVVNSAITANIISSVIIRGNADLDVTATVLGNLTIHGNFSNSTVEVTPNNTATVALGQFIVVGTTQSVDLIATGAIRTIHLVGSAIDFVVNSTAPITTAIFRGQMLGSNIRTNHFLTALAAADVSNSVITGGYIEKLTIGGDAANVDINSGTHIAQLVVIGESDTVDVVVSRDIGLIHQVGAAEEFDITAGGHVGTIVFKQNATKSDFDGRTARLISVGGDLSSSNFRFTESGFNTLALSQILVRGDMSSTILNAAGNIGAVVAGGDLLGSVVHSSRQIISVTAARMVSSRLLSGLKDTTVVFPVATTDPFTRFSTTTTPVGGIGTVTLAPTTNPNGSFVNSVIAAASIGKAVLHQVKMDNDGDAFGITSDTIGLLWGREVGTNQVFLGQNLRSSADVASQFAGRDFEDFELRLVS